MVANEMQLITISLPINVYLRSVWFYNGTLSSSERQGENTLTSMHTSTSPCIALVVFHGMQSRSLTWNVISIEIRLRVCFF